MGLCEVCGKNPATTSRCSGLGPVTFAYCGTCAETKAEPYHVVLSVLVTSGPIPPSLLDYRCRFTQGGWEIIQTCLLVHGKDVAATMHDIHGLEAMRQGMEGEERTLALTPSSPIPHEIWEVVLREIDALMVEVAERAEANGDGEMGNALMALAEDTLRDMGGKTLFQPALTEGEVVDRIRRVAGIFVLLLAGVSQNPA